METKDHDLAALAQTFQKLSDKRSGKDFLKIPLTVGADTSNEDDGTSTQELATEQLATQMLSPAPVASGDKINLKTSSPELQSSAAWKRRGGIFELPTIMEEGLEAIREAQAGTSNTDSAIETDFRALFVPRELEILYKSFKSVSDPEKRRNPVEAPWQRKVLDRAFVMIPSYHTFGALEEELKPRRGHKVRQQRQRGIPALNIPEFGSLEEFSDWFIGAERNSGERKVKMTRMRLDLATAFASTARSREPVGISTTSSGMESINPGSEKDDPASGMAVDVTDRETTDKLANDLDKLTKKAQKCDMQLAAFTYCHHVCSRLGTCINHLESEMKTRLRSVVSVSNKAVWQLDFVDKIMIENQIRQYGKETPSTWAHQQRQLVLGYINKHAMTVREKVRGQQSTLFLVWFDT